MFCSLVDCMSKADQVSEIEKAHNVYNPSFTGQAMPQTILLDYCADSIIVDQAFVNC